MADLAELELRIKSAEAQTAEARLRKMSAQADIAEKKTDKFGKTTEKADRSVGKFGKSVGRAATRTRGLNTATGQMSKTMQTAVIRLRGLVAGFVGLAAARAAITTIAQFEEQMVTVGQVTRASASEMEALEGTARQLGATTRFMATEVAEGLTFLARAGFSVTESIAAIPATLNLAQVGMIDLGQAADFASNILSQFNLKASETERVVDAMVVVSNRSNTNVLQMAEAMKFAGTVAGALGISVEETAAAIGVMGDEGIQASLAGASLRGIFAQLKKPTAEATRAIRDMGLALFEVDPERVGIIRAFEALVKAGLDADKAFRIFSLRTAAGALAIASNVPKLNELAVAMAENRGEAERFAKAYGETLPGKFKTFISAIQEAILATGEGGLTGSLKELVDVGTEIARSFGRDGAAGALGETLKVAGQVVLFAQDITKLQRGLVDIAATPARLAFELVFGVGPGDALGELRDAITGQTDATRALIEKLSAADKRGQSPAGFASPVRDIELAAEKASAISTGNTPGLIAAIEEQLAIASTRLSITEKGFISLNEAMRAMMPSEAVQFLDRFDSTVANLLGLRSAFDKLNTELLEARTIVGKFGPELLGDRTQAETPGELQAPSPTERLSVTAGLQLQLDLARLSEESALKELAVLALRNEAFKQGASATEAQAQAVRDLVGGAIRLQEEAKRLQQLKQLQGDVKFAGATVGLRDSQKRIEAARQDFGAKGEEEQRKLEKLRELDDALNGFVDSLSFGMQDAFRTIIRGGENVSQQLKAIFQNLVADIATQVFTKVAIDPLVDLLASGLNSIFGAAEDSQFQFAKSVRDFQIAVQQFSSSSGGSGGGSGGGGGGGGNISVSPSGGSVPFGHGAVVNNGIFSKPTHVPILGGGLGVAGEAGTEVLVPVRRMPSGDLGVQSAGGGDVNSNNVTKHINVKLIVTGVTDTDDFRRNQRSIERGLAQRLRDLDL